MSENTFNWGFVVIPAGFTEDQIPALMEKIKEMVQAKTASNQKELLFGFDIIETNMFGCRSKVMEDVTAMISKIGNPNLITEKVWRQRFTMLFVQGIQADEASVKDYTIKVVKTIAKADLADKAWLESIGLPSLQDLCISFAQSFA